MFNFLRYLTIFVILYHLLIFISLKFFLEAELKKNNSHHCICDVNFLTGTYYLCGDSLISSFFTKYFTGRVVEPNIIYPLSYINPVKIEYNYNIICNKI
jgi:hypothetical protein